MPMESLDNFEELCCMAFLQCKKVLSLLTLHMFVIQSEMNAQPFLNKLPKVN